MSVGRRKLVPFWVLALALACGQHAGQAQQDTLKSDHEHHSDFSLLQGHDAAPLRGVTIIPPLRTIPVVRALNPAHTGRVCSTWGDFHYKTFDGQVFRFPGLCNYVFSAHCGAAYEDFNIQLRRGRESNATALSRVTMKLDGLVVDLTKSSVSVNNHLVQLPFSQSGVLIELSSGYLKVVARLGLVFMWNDDDSLLLELDTKYINKTCGLCGDFNGSPESSEFLSHNVRLTPLEFGNLQKMDGPTEQCQDPLPVPQKNCSTRFGICEEILKGHLFSDCSALVDTSSYLEACQQDLCLCESPDLSSCICHTLAEYSRQCAHAGGQPQDWRGPNLCSPTCPLNMQHQECGSPCVDTCSNLQRSQVCEDHCVASCFCPEGMVLDDINQTGCVPVSQCACLYNGTAYAPGTNYSTDCTKCTCSGGQWSCQEVPCPGTCSVLGGSHFSTFDERQYTVHGDCSYVLSKPCDSNIFTVLAELRKCGLTDSETCLKSVTLSLGGGKTVVMVKATGEVFVNQIYTHLPVSTANVTLFRPSTFFIIAQTNLGLQLEIQLVPIMQVFVRLAPELRGLTCGLCGNFNSIQADDFQTISGVVEGTAAAFFNTFKTQAACPNVRNNFEDPCSLSVENEKYAQHWCSQLMDANGPFSQCHTTVNPSTYFLNCMFDTCNCEKSEDCMCAALSSYVHACAAKGVLLSGWRDSICTKPTTTCPKSMTYQYHISTCQPTCRSLNEEDVTCHVNFIPVDGCTCPAGTFLDDSGKCVQATSCPCYHRGSMVPNGESIHDSGAICTCTQGTLTCIGGPAPTPVCDAPMIYFDCRNATPGDTGAGCQKSCHILDMTCYSSECVPGCVCPDGLVADGNGGCVVAEDCPCVHNEATYRPGETIRVGCNNCTCENRMWRCTDKPCLATCAVYGDGHYLTFDGQRYSFSGNCEYTLLQDHCGGNGSSQDAFRVVTENVPCGTTGTTCSKDIKIFLGNYELKLSDGKVEVVQKGTGQEPPYYVHQMGIYLVVETDIGLVLLWDRKTSIFLRLSPEFKGRVCGLCGNFDDNAINDFTTRSQSVVSDMLEFGNSWKFSPSCPDAVVSKDPCTANPYRKSWAQKQCSIINSATFTACHAHVEPAKYYEACVSDACACDSGGDCECFCTAVAAYAQACHEVGVCVSWRTPDICPLFCDYYNPEGQCEWHYETCGAPCMRTCQNPNGHCLHDLHGLEGCYPKCPPTAPIFDEGTMQCVRNCTVTPSPPPPRPCRVNGKLYRPGATVPSDKNCYSCICTENGVSCARDAGACVCTYNGQHFHPGDIIYHTTDGTGGCISAHCRANGTIERTIDACSSTTPTPPTTFSFSTPVVMTSMPPSSTHPSPTLSVVYTGSPSRAVLTTSSMSSAKTPATAPTLTASSMASTSTTPGCQECHWSPWMDVSHPGRGIDSGDFETLENLRAHGYQICQAPRAVECRAEESPEVPLHVLGQHVECSTAVGLTCHNRDQVSRLCENYQIRIQCCIPISCPTSSGPSQTTHLIISRTATMGTTTSLGPVPSTDHTDTTVISGHSTHLSGPLPSSSHPSSSAPSPSTLAPVSSTAIRVNLSTTSLMPEPNSATSSVSIPTAVSTTASFETTHECKQELCSWTDWIDGSYPGPERDSGDFDTFVNLRSKGYKFCEKPRNVECRAQFFPNTPLEELGQDVICNREEGLICLNKNQLPPICYNYEIRIECCKVVDMCSMDTATTHPTSHEVSTTKTNWTTSWHSSSTKDTSTHSATIHTETWATESPQTITQAGTTHCQPQCNWTKWFDTDFPVPGPHGGDLETYSNILRRGERICHRPEEITQLECRAENHPEMRVEDLGQVVQCDPTVGLVCRNRDQKDISGMCLNYEVRVLCCRIPEGCPATTRATLSSTPRETVTSSAPGTTSVHAAISTSLPQTRTTIVQTTSTTSTPQTSSTSVHTASTRGTSSTSGQTASTTSMPKPRPTSGQTASTTSMPKPKPTPGKPVSTTSTPQTSSTSVHRASTSGTSSTSGQTASTTSMPKPKTTPGQPVSTTSKPQTTTTPLGKPSTTSGHPASTMSTRTTSNTTVQTTSTTSTPQTSSTSVHTASTSGTSSTSGQTASTTSMPKPRPTPGQPVSTTSKPQTTTTPLGKSSTTSGHPASTMSTRTTSTTSVQTGSTISMPKSGPIPGQPVSTTSKPQTTTTPLGKPSTTSGHPASTMFTRTTSTTSEQTASTTFIGKTGTVSVPATRATSAPTSTTGPGSPSGVTSFPGTTHCQPQCNWTKWFDTDFPVPGPHGGDLETYSNILRSGERICHRPEEITQLECRAENHPEMRVEDLGQVVQCDPTVGLVCRNRDQKDISGMCLNYEVRVLCCRIPEGCPATTRATLSSTPRETVTSSAPGTTSVHAAISTSLPQTRTTIVQTTSTTSTPQTSSTSVHTASTRGTSSTSGQTASTTSMPKPRPTSGQTASTTSMPKPKPTPGKPVSTTSTPQTSSTSVHRASTSGTSSTSGQTASTTSMPKSRPTSGQPVSTTSKPQTTTTPLGKSSTTSGHPASTMSTRTTSTTSEQTASTTFIGKTGTVSVPATRATSAPTSTTGPGSLSGVTSFPGTTHCQPQCNWTEWFDTDFPVPGPHGGDLETYSNILRSGERICHHPEEITQLECRAENHPEMRVEDLGQVVQCDPTVGLVCRNRDQKDISGMCLNYEVRVLCCRIPEGCPATTRATLSSTPRETVTSSAPGTTSVHAAISTSLPQTRTTIVQTTSTTSTPQTSSTSVHTASTRGTSSTSGQTASTTSMPKPRPTPGQPVSTTSTPQTTTTPLGKPSTTSGHPASTMSTRTTSTTSVQTGSTTSMPKSGPIPGQPVSTTSKPQTTTTPLGKSSTTSGQTASTMSTRTTSTTTVQTASTTSMPKSRPTSGQTASTTSKPQTTTTPLGKSSTTSGQTASTMSTRTTSTTSEQTASTTSMPKSRPTSGQPVSTTSKPQTTTTPLGKSSTTSGHPASTMSTRTTSTTSEQTASTTFIGKTGTVSVPATRATSAPTSTTGPGSLSGVTSFPGTTHCQPQCNWTEWFDTDFPVPGPHGGDLETYSNILRSGERICHHPEEITQLECRAENHPEMRVEDLGQVVQCDPTVGLVCRNRDQKDISGMCLNYEVRVLCCRIPEGCPLTSSTPPVTSSQKPSFPVVSPTSASPSSSSSPRVHSTTPCFCSVAGHLYPIGSIIYNQTDLDGHCYYAVCSQDCQVVRSVSQDCPSTMPSPTPALFTSTSTMTPVIHRDRCNVFPPRMKGDIWHMPNCSQAICEGNNVVSLSPRQCPEVKAPSCANGYPPVKVDDQDGCCQHYQCQCVCSGWGDPHYVTFDGTYYTFLDNCTYVLVQQIVPVFGHFRVLIDNYFCDLGDSVSCPQSIIVEYHQDRVVLTRRPVDGIMTNQIIFNNKVVSPGFQQNGIVVSRVGIKMYVTIQEIGVQVMFSGLIFSVEVPLDMFGNNTEGQCGTCTNDKKDECRLPGGAITSCSKMAPHWKVPNQPSCQGPPPTSTSVVPSPSLTPCPPSPICELLLSKVFQSCHDIIPPLAFYEGCLFDSCHGLTLEVVCSALELYASLCAAQGRCIPWRSQTNNTCPFTCPDNKVYQPCGPTNPQYCYRNDDISTSLTLQEAGPFTEGCFCPDNMTPFSTNDSICVPSCQWCLGPHGEPVEPGHTISISCEDCICKEATLTCQRKPCPQTTCPEPGFVPVPEALEAGQCCPQFSCACNSSYCPPPLHCPENSSLMVTYEEGACCPRQVCSSRKGCEVNGTLYQPGAVISSSLCETCLCEVPSNFHSDGFVVSCETKLCSNIQCPQGFEYQVKPEQCCGQCIQKGCLVKNSNSSTYFYLPGESWPEPEDSCVTHKCEKLQDVFTIVTMKKECPKIHCPPGHAQLREDGCCYDCLLPQQKCTVHQKQQIIRQQNCSSEGPVSLSYCQGNCGDSTSMYSLEANTVEHKCECCQELQTSQRSVTLHCDDGSSRTFSYTQVEKCGCLGQRCHALGDTSHPESSESEFKSKESKEHGQQSAFRASEEVLGPSQ